MTRKEIQVLIDNIATGVPNTALKVRTILNTLADGAFQTGDVKEIDVATSYIASNFDVTGLGINERVGWAICNGQNGTRDRRGRVAMMYSASYPTLGSTGGEYKHTLTTAEMPVHDHDLNMVGYNLAGAGGAEYVVRSSGTQVAKPTLSEGGGTAHNIMQPYMVTLMIMKL